MAVRVVTRRGVRRLFIDIRYKNPDGTRARYRKDADVQTMAGARAEERRCLAALVATGSPCGLKTEEPATACSPNVTEEPPPAHVHVAPGRAAPAPAVPPPVENGVTFKEVVDEYLRSFAPSRLKPSTQTSYGKVIHGLLLPRLGKRLAASIDATVVRELDLLLVRRGTRSSTRRNVQTVLRSILCRFAVEAGLLEAPPRLPKMPPVGRNIVSTLTRDQVRKLLDVSPKAHRLAFMLAAYAGLRAGEVRGLRVRDVDLVAGHLIVRQSICHGIAAAPKSGHQRIVPLVPELREALADIQGRDRDALVSTTARRKPWGEFSLHKAFVSACNRAGLEGWRFHDLRHYFVTALFRGGAAAPVVQKLAGHAHLVTTERYAHVAETDLVDAIRRLTP